MSRRWPGVGVALARSQQSPDAITAQPPDHQRLDSLPFAKTFRRKGPLFDAAIWSSHDLQIAAYDALLAGRSQADRRRAIVPPCHLSRPSGRPPGAPFAGPLRRALL